MSQNNQANSQALEGYRCTCGYITDDMPKFRTHLVVESQADKKNGKPLGQHKSDGRVNMLTGEITMPPFNQRTKEQQKESSIGKRNKDKKSDNTAGGFKTTEVLSQATMLRFTPRQMNCTYTPIMQATLEAVTRVFAWRADMPLENVIDTIFYNYMLEHGVQLAGYIVDPSVLNELAQEQADAEAAMHPQGDIITVDDEEEPPITPGTEPIELIPDPGNKRSFVSVLAGV